MFTSAATKLTNKHFCLQMNKFIMVVEVVEQFATVLTLFRCFLPNGHCSHDLSLYYWLCIYCHITNNETLPATDEDMLKILKQIGHNRGTFLKNLGVLLAYDNECCVNNFFKCAWNSDF